MLRAAIIAQGVDRGTRNPPSGQRKISALSYMPTELTGSSLSFTRKENSMNLPKLARIVGLSLIAAAASLPVFAERPCSCVYCSQVSNTESCNFFGTHTTCGDFLAVTLCTPL